MLHSYTSFNLEDNPSLFKELIVCNGFREFYANIRFQTDAQPLIEYDKTQGIWAEVSRSKLLIRIQAFVIARPGLCTPSSTTRHFYEKVARALEIYMKHEFVTTPGILHSVTHC